MCNTGFHKQGVSFAVSGLSGPRTNSYSCSTFAQRNCPFNHKWFATPGRPSAARPRSRALPCSPTPPGRPEPRAPEVPHCCPARPLSSGASAASPWKSPVSATTVVNCLSWSSAFSILCRFTGEPDMASGGASGGPTMPRGPRPRPQPIRTRHGRADLRAGPGGAPPPTRRPAPRRAARCPGGPPRPRHGPRPPAPGPRSCASGAVRTPGDVPRGGFPKR